MSKLEEQILNEAHGLPEKALVEILKYIQGIKDKFQGKKKPNDNNILIELSELDKNETEHLENEVANYKKLYPHE